MDLHQLETFLAVVREGSFSGAAKGLGRTQPAISQVISRLEEEVGQRLFERPGRRGGLTDAGKTLLEYAERLIGVRQQALVALDDVRELRAGRLGIAANELTCLYLLPVLHEFRRLYPGVSVTVQRSLASRVPAGVLDYTVDMGVISYEPAEPGLRSAIVYHDQLVFVVPPAHPLARRSDVSIAMLGNESFVAHHVASPYRARVLDAFRRHRVTLHMPVEMPTIDAIKRFVALGHGVALLPHLSVEAELTRGDLVQVAVPELALDRQLRLVVRRQGEFSHAVRAFLAVAEHQAATLGGRFAFTWDPSSAG
ncbi:MAG: LysR family transcriptional regulator [Vicinamibacterales bacterium]